MRRERSWGLVEEGEKESEKEYWVEGSREEEGRGLRRRGSSTRGE